VNEVYRMILTINDDWSMSAKWINFYIYLI
jgi:hypothetical protein